MSVMRGRRSKPAKALIILVCVVGFISLFSFIVMKLWNAVLPDVLHVTQINFWQAMGILVLSKILFGGFGPWGGKKHEWKKRMQDKWQHMTPEERSRFKETLEKRFEGRFGRRWCVPDFDKEEKRKDEAANNQAGAE
jgi:Ca2+/H+ antiporter, TMEM165/GDT1 family